MPSLQLLKYDPQQTYNGICRTAILQGQLCGLNTNGTIELAASISILGPTSANTAVGFAIKDCPAGGMCALCPNCTIDGYTGLLTGQKYFMSDTLGTITTTQSTTGNANRQYIGIAKSPTILHANIASPFTIGSTLAHKAIWGPSRICATKGHSGTNEANTVTGGFFTTTTDLFGTYCTSHIITTNCRDLRVFFINQSCEALTTNSVTYACAILYSGAIYPFTFNGSAQITLAPGGMIISDPIGLELTQGTTIQIRTRPGVGIIGQKWPLGPATSNIVAGEGYTTGVDYTTVTTAVASVTGYTCCPNAILGTTNPSAAPIIGGYGDSILASKGEMGFAGATGYDIGFFGRMLQNKFGYMRVGCGLDTAQNNATAINRLLRAKMLNGCDWILCQFGTNDIMNNARTAAQVAADVSSICTSISQQLGVPIYGWTIPPKSTSTDGWVTVNNQTTVVQNSIRVTYNNLVRAGIAGQSGYIEAAWGVTESTPDSGLWIAGGTGDGVHPTVLADTAIANSVNTAIFSYYS